MRSAAVSGLAFAALWLMLAWPTGPAHAAGEAHKTLKGFQRTGKYILVVDGRRAHGTRVYFSRLASAYLLLDSPYDKALLISPRTRDVRSVSLEKMVERSDGLIYFTKETQPAALVRFTFERGQVTFKIGSKAGQLRPTPPLVGLKTGAELIEHTPEYLRSRATYRPDPSAIEALKGKSGEVLVVFGSWCSTCARYLPQILKIEQALAGSGITFRYHGLPRAPGAWRDPAFVNSGIKRLPGVVVTSRGRVTSRLSGNEVSRLETRLRSSIR